MPRFSGHCEQVTSDCCVMSVWYQLSLLSVGASMLLMTKFLRPRSFRRMQCSGRDNRDAGEDCVRESKSLLLRASLLQHDLVQKGSATAPFARGPSRPLMPERV